MRQRRVSALVVPLVAVALLAACGTGGTSAAAGTSAPATASTTASPSPSSTNPYGAAPVDPPGPTEPVLSVTGRAGTTTYTLGQLEALGTRTLTIAEPFVKAPRTFTGVPMATLLDAAGITGSTTVLTTALNDYRYSNTAAAFTGSQALVAISQDGGAVPFDQGGPVRIVFPDDTPLTSVLDAWNWSLSSLKATG